MPRILPLRRSLSGAAVALLAACSDADRSGPLAPDPDPRRAVSLVAFADEFDAWDATRWSAEEHPLGRGTFRAANVVVQGGRAELVMPAGAYDGGEIRSADRFRYGSFRARMRTPAAPGSISAFFLYQGLEASDEIDIEIFNDGSRRIMFTYWIAGRQVQSVTRTLPFDPSAADHDYRIDWSSNTLRFSVDGVVMQQWKGKMPRGELFLMSNSWWPVWLSGPHPAADARLSVDRIEAIPG